MKIGIFFGGPSREREIAFAGGRTVYDNLNKQIFEPIPIFVDSNRNLILLNWEYVYKGSIRDFYPPVEVLPPSKNEFQIYIESLGKLSQEEQDKIIAKVGKKVALSELSSIIDIAFLSLHGSYGEDGQLQGLLDSLQIPYTGSGVRACSIGMDKAFQKKIMEAAGFDCPKVKVIQKTDWKKIDIEKLYAEVVNTISLPLVIRPANQGSSIGVSILEKESSIADFKKAIDAAFFKLDITAKHWTKFNGEEKVNFIKELTDLRYGIGFPLTIKEKTFYHPENLLTFIEAHFSNSSTTISLESHWSEQRVIIEEFIHGKEFSCIVARKENGEVIALPPTEIVKGSEVFDYRSKYLPGLSRKVTPIDLDDARINAIRKACEELFKFLQFETYARIDGFIRKDDKIFLNDPNTTSGMLPSSFFFHQAAEIGLNPSQFLTFIVRTSLMERINSALDKAPYEDMLTELDEAILSLKTPSKAAKKIAVILGGYSFERHISVESGRNVFEKLASSEQYEPIPVFLSGKAGAHTLHQIPINLLLKDNADDIKDKIEHFKKHPIVEEIKMACRDITNKYASADVVFEPQHLTYESLTEKVDGVFIALHGRPGEDGEVQEKLEQYGLPYNGSDKASSSITIDKYRTLQILKENGFEVTHQLLLEKAIYEKDMATAIARIEADFNYPFIAKPVDDGCSSAVKVIKNQAYLSAYLKAIFRNEAELTEAAEKSLGLKPKEEFPQKEVVLIEALITAKGAKKFLEVTGGLFTKYKNGAIEYEMFEPSEALASGAILSLEEKFLAGEGQNITPARFSNNSNDYTYIASQVKADLERAAKILNVKGYARIDAFVRIFEDNRAETIIIEVNSLPGMTPATCIFHQSAINGYKPYEFIDRILEFGFTQRNIKQGVELS